MAWLINNSINHDFQNGECRFTYYTKSKTNEPHYGLVWKMNFPKGFTSNLRCKKNGIEKIYVVFPLLGMLFLAGTEVFIFLYLLPSAQQLSDNLVASCSTSIELIISCWHLSSQIGKEKKREREKKKGIGHRLTVLSHNISLGFCNVKERMKNEEKVS